ncbi:cytochrome P450 [Tamaricihabitans halophyticus]|uniref:Cytochrome P450 n=1 Tax=Tamaricihabitans halophyticus TaxID=1262583 RepID=A0A4R2R3L0_9PSEU|nr:cytochrome P450 [Tamaricihabitans halophyticus]TCP57153.1 cytochrome P450 [Tamaricihabitans halophyticus]
MPEPTDLFDPADLDFLADPYPTFARLRAEGEVHWHGRLQLAITTSHAAASAVLRHRGLGRLWQDATPLDRFVSFNLLHRNSLLENEPPAHGRLRRLIAAAFTRGHVERLRPTVAKVAEGMVDELAETSAAHGQADLLATLAQPLPIAVITELLGVPRSDGPRLVELSNAIVKMYEYGLAEERKAEAERAAEEFVEYLRRQVTERRASPREDLLSDLVAVRDTDGTRLTEDELVATAVLVLMAGHEASVNVLGNGMRALLEEPAQWQRLTKDPALVESAAEELIRFDAPLQLFERTATEPVEIAGYRLAEGDKIAALLGAAARDPTVFTDPDLLDIGRSPNPHLGFGGGIHYCVGAPLARLEITAALTALATRAPGLALAATPRRRPEFVIRGLRDLPVRVDQRG